MEKMRNMYNVLVGKPEGKTSFGIPSHRWKDNIKIMELCLHLYLHLIKLHAMENCGGVEV
jgi:hypothetical protein